MGGARTLEFCVGERDSALLVEEQPVAVVWDVAHDSAHQYFVRAYDTASVDEKLRRHRELLTETVDPHLPLQDQFRPILQLFPSGNYTLIFEPGMDLDDDPLPSQDVKELWSSWRFMDWAGLHHVAAGEGLLLGSRPREFLDARRIRFYEDQIRDGARPIVVMAGALDSDTAFIVDGHHKMEAYRRLRKSPGALFILAEEPRFMTVDEGCDLIAEAYARCAEIAAAHYRAVRAVPAVAQRA